MGAGARDALEVAVEQGRAGLVQETKAAGDVLQCLQGQIGVEVEHAVEQQVPQAAVGAGPPPREMVRARYGSRCRFAADSGPSMQRQAQ